MNLRNADDYNIGLDIGVASVGWAVTDLDGELLYIDGKPCWGSRTFPEAKKASETRNHRSQRRRYDRRRQRLDLLQMLFAEEMEKVDPEFFVRLNQSRLLREDRDPAHSDYHWPLFNTSDFTEKDYYEKFPTIYHLRSYLSETTEKADIRLIYLALHNIVKHRGNFLQQDNKSLSAKSAKVDESVKVLCSALHDWCEQYDIECSAQDNVDPIIKALQDRSQRGSSLRETLAPLFGINPGLAIDKSQARNLSKAISGAIVGLKADLEKVFFLFDDLPEGIVANIYLSKDDQVGTLDEVIPDESQELYAAIKRVYSSYVLQEMLIVQGTISVNKVAAYDRYKTDLKTLKDLVKEYVPEQYDEFFRGATYERLYPGEKKKYDVSEAKGYTLYNLRRNRAYEDFKRDVEKLFKITAAVIDLRYVNMMESFGEETFLRRLKTSDNGAIPFQLHLEEMNDIIENQKKFYSFLEADQTKLNSLVEFRIPYYVGPLTQTNARRERDKTDGKTRFAWAVRKEGKENERVYPWNWGEIIDKNRSAADFITRMTGTCTYIQGEPVLPKSSLLYEEFCVLNELNGSKYSMDGDKFYPFDYQDRYDMMDELFRNGSVTHKKVSDWMNRRRGHMNVRVSGTQGEKGFESRLSSYLFFKKHVFGVDEIPRSDFPMIEEIILWSTIFEDRDILREKLKETYGDRLSDEQIKKICRKRFTGWGKLSRRFLTEVKAQTDDGPYSIIDVLRMGDPNNGHGSKAMVLMEALRDDKLQFQKLVDEINKQKLTEGRSFSLDDLSGSPALRRGVNQAMSIVKEIVNIAGHAPTNIFVEVTRSDDNRSKGKRTKKRYDNLKEHLEAFKRENPDFWEESILKELKSTKPGDLNEKLTLFFMQGGKSLYSGKPLQIDRLSEYQVDHIIPQSYIKDDSFENKALVLSEENQRKSDQMLLPADMRRKMNPYWRALKDAGLIGEKKYNNLMRDEIKEKRLKGFINRQIVETSQIVKFVQMTLQELYPETNVLPVKAGLSSELRKACDFVKCREINDFHHAHDALLATEIGRFIQIRYPEMYENPLKYQKAIRSFVKRESAQVRSGKTPYGSSFIISSFKRPGFDENTGEVIEDAWNSSKEIELIRKCLNYRQCYISRMPEETSGAFWDATIYSPHDTKKKDQLKLPLKKGLDPKKYGSYSREQFAYFFIFEGEKNDKATLELRPVPVSVVSVIKSKPTALEEYAKTIADSEGLKFKRIVREKVLKYQIIEVEGSRLYVTGQKEVRNAFQIAFDQHETKIAKQIAGSDDEAVGSKLDSDAYACLFYRIKHSISKYSPRLAKAIKLGEWDDAFFNASQKDQRDVIFGITSIAAGNTNVVDLQAVGGSKFSGNMQPTFSKLFLDSEAFVIDQSVTGMFERRTRIGL